MKMKFMILLLSLFVLRKTYGYVFSPEIDRLIIYNEQYTAYTACQASIPALQVALLANVSLDNVPSRPIMDKDVPFNVYTRKNPNTPIILYTNDSVEKFRSSLNVEAPTTFYIHGLNQTVAAGTSNFTTYLLPRFDINIIIVNWDSYTAFQGLYTTIITYPRLAEIVGRFVGNLTKAGADRKKVHIIGFSAGGEIAGLAGKTINPKVGRISGTYDLHLAYDPQGNCFNLAPTTERISQGDADFVEIVHCSVGNLGLRTTIEGNVTFIMNGGIIQPQCANLTTINDLGVCSHLQCERYLYDVLKGNSSFVGIKCDSSLNLVDYNLNQCNCQDRLALTYEVPTSAKGLYAVDTVSNNPCNITG